MSPGADAYVDGLPRDRREVVRAVREVINANLPPGYVEGTGYKIGMVVWHVPEEDSPRTYNGRPLALAALGNRQSYVTLYLMQLAHDSRERSRFEVEWRATGIPLRMGKAAVTFRSLDDVALDVVAAHVRRTTVDDLIAAYELAWAR